MSIKKEILSTSSISVQDSFSVRLIGLEPTRREAPDPKSGVSTNFTTPAGAALHSPHSAANIGSFFK